MKIVKTAFIALFFILGSEGLLHNILHCNIVILNIQLALKLQCAIF